LTLSNEGIVQLINSYDKQSKALKNEALKLSWYMRGGLSYEESMYLSSDERDMISKIIEENLEVTKKSGIPFF